MVVSVAILLLCVRCSAATSCTAVCRPLWTPWRRCCHGIYRSSRWALQMGHQRLRNQLIVTQRRHTELETAVPLLQLYAYVQPVNLSHAQTRHPRAPLLVVLPPNGRLRIIMVELRTRHPGQTTPCCKFEHDRKLFRV